MVAMPSQEPLVETIDLPVEPLHLPHQRRHRKPTENRRNFSNFAS
jgi:hypothetical protein